MCVYLDSGWNRATHHTAAGNETGLVTHTLAGMKGSLPEIIWYNTTPTLLQKQATRQQHHTVKGRDTISYRSRNVAVVFYTSSY